MRRAAASAMPAVTASVKSKTYEMTINWNQSYNPEVILDKIEKRRKISDNGKVSFTGFEISIFETILHSMLIFPTDLPEVLTRNWIFKTLINIGEKGEINKTRFIAEINRICNSFIETPIQKFVLLTSLSIESNIPRKIFHLGSETIILDTKIPKRFINEANNLYENIKSRISFTIPNNYFFVRITTHGRSIHEAAQNALDSLDLFRSIFNYYENLHSQFRITFDGRHEPVNKILLGPIHTLHDTQGNLLSKDTFWFEENFREKASLFDLNKKFDKSLEFYKLFKKRLRKLNYANEISEAMIRYTRSLDEQNWYNSYLNLWGVLEFLTNPNKWENKDNIKRTLFVYKDNEYHRQVLTHLRDYRNRLVHSNLGNTEIESFLYQLKSIIEKMINFHIGNNLNFQTFEDACNFMDLPVDRDILFEKKKKIEQVIKLFKY